MQTEKTESSHSKHSAIGVRWIRRGPFCDPENFSSGYIMRSEDILFKRGSGEPGIHMLEYHQEREPCRTPTLMTDPSSTAEPASHPESMMRPRPGKQPVRETLPVSPL